MDGRPCCHPCARMLQKCPREYESYMYADSTSLPGHSRRSSENPPSLRSTHPAVGKRGPGEGRGTRVTGGATPETENEGGRRRGGGGRPERPRARQVRPFTTPRSPAKNRYGRYEHASLDEMRAQRRVCLPLLCRILLCSFKTIVARLLVVARAAASSRHDLRQAVAGRSIG